MFKTITNEVEKMLRKAGVGGEIVLSTPPKPEMGDLAFSCFGLAKEAGKKPNEVALDLELEVRSQKSEVLERVEAVGPYVNFYLNPLKLAEAILKGIEKEGKNYGRGKIGKGKKIMVEFAHPNTHKAFHIGHLRNITTGESIVRILENVGYKVVRANYQGDVGLHIAKCLWGILESPKSNLPAEASAQAGVQSLKSEAVEEKVRFLGEAYARGSQAYESDEQAKTEILDLNEKIYQRNPSVLKMYQTTREWSLEYFNKIYKRVGSRFDRLYFESETFERGKEIVLEFLKKGIFKKSEGAVIFEGEKFGLHSRVFLNSKGLPTYEAKDLALAELQFKEYHPDLVLHVVAREQAEYFKVLFKALEFTLPESKNKEEHLVYGWVSLKEGKMSSRTGNVVLGEWLIDEVKQRINEVMEGREVSHKEQIEEKVAIAAVKYTFLRTGINNDIIFDFKESVSLTGDSGPYLLYTIARIKSIFRKYGGKIGKLQVPKNIEQAEKKILIRLSNFPEVNERAALDNDPSKIAHYLLDLAQDFNDFYNICPVLKAQDDVLFFRLYLINTVAQVMERGLWLLGIGIAEEM